MQTINGSIFLWNENSSIVKRINKEALNFSSTTVTTIGQSYRIYSDSGIGILNKITDEVLGKNEDIIGLNIFDSSGKVLYKRRTKDNGEILLQYLPFSLERLLLHEATVQYLNTIHGRLIDVIVPYKDQQTSLQHFSIRYIYNYQSLDKNFTNFLTIVGIISALCISLGLIAALFFSNVLTSAINGLVRLVEEFRFELNDGYSIYAFQNYSSKTQEIDQLAQAFASLCEQLRSRTMEVNNKNKELRKIDALKDQFMANTSHELRTPLVGIIGVAEQLKTINYKESAQNQLELIIQSGRRLNQLVADMLDFSKLKEGNLALVFKASDLNQMTLHAKQLCTPLLKDPSISIILDVPQDIPYVWCDENRIQQVLLNLLSNAIKFTEKGNIILRCRVINTQVEISIIDTGIGISPDDQTYIFEPFYQVEDKLEEHNTGGTGLGLSITKKLLEMHHTELYLQSHLGEGTCFSFTLDITQNIESNILQVEHQEHIPTIYHNEVEELIQKHNNQFKNDQLIGNQYNDSLPTILVVDDEAINVHVICQHLESLPCNILVAYNGLDAIEAFKHHTINLVLLDLMMPKMNGFDVCQHLRTKYLVNEVPIIILTARTQMSDLVKSYDMGANDYITKPFLKEELLKRAKAHLNIAYLSKSYARFLPLDFLKHLKHDSVIDIVSGDHAKHYMTVLFLDIRNFTSLSEQMDSTNVFYNLNYHFKQIAPIIREHNGFIDKFLGDGFFALFAGDEHAKNSLDAAIEILKKMNGTVSPFGDIKIGIGINSGELILGVLGEPHRLESTVISDVVNVAARVETLCKNLDKELLITDAVYQQLEQTDNYTVQYLKHVHLRGRIQNTTIYEVLTS